MPELVVFAAFVLGVIVTTGALLDRRKVRRSRRVLVWVGLFLLLPCVALAFLMYLLFRDGWRYC